jgi:hypothetical protein
MILSKFQVGVAASIVLVMAAGLVWEIRENTQLRSEAVRQSKSATASLAVLEKQATAESLRVAEAEANVATLLKSAKTASATRGAVPPGANATIDMDNAGKSATARGSQLIKEGKLQEALDEYLTCYRELQAIRPGSTGCQRLMDAIKRLGRTYPAALLALAGLRDSAMQQRQAQPSRSELPFEIALLNESLGEGSRTLALYDSLPPDDIQRRGLAMIAIGSFIEARRYTDALIGKPFGQMLSVIEMGPGLIEKEDASRQAALKKAILDATLTNLEVLTGAGKTEDARTLTEKLLAFDSSDATRASLQQHVDRAQAPRQ